MIKNILVPDPELRYGLKQVMSNTWCKKTFQSPDKLSEGIEVGIDQIKIFDNVIKEMQVQGQELKAVKEAEFTGRWERIRSVMDSGATITVITKRRATLRSH